MSAKFFRDPGENQVATLERNPCCGYKLHNGKDIPFGPQDQVTSNPNKFHFWQCAGAL